MHTRLILTVLLLLTVNGFAESPTVSIRPPVKVIVAAGNDTTQLSRKQVSDIFLKKTLRWKNAMSIVPFDLKYDDPARELFSKFIHGRSPSFIKKYWQQQIFSGYNLPPLEKDRKEIAQAVAAEPGAVGYVPAEMDLPANVKEIEVRE